MLGYLPLILLSLSTNPGATAPDDKTPPMVTQDKEENYLFYILTVANAPVYEQSSSEVLVAQPNPLRLGEVYFALARENGRVHLGEYDDKAGKWSSILGWVDERDLIANRLTPLTVGQALEKGLSVRRSESLGGLNPSNVLHLRCVSKPDSRLQAGSAPSLRDGKEIQRFVWFYIYDIRIIDNVAWLLAGHRSNLSNTSGISANSLDAAPSRNLLGWLPLDGTSLWCSNQVLEFNTNPDAIRQRTENNRPATVHVHHDRTSAPLFVEPTATLNTALTNPAAYPSIQVDPIGLAADYPRFVVIQSYPGDWLEVASVGSSDGSISQPQIALMKIKATEFANSLRKVDLAIVVDRSASMGPEIAQVISFLTELAKKLGELQSQGTTTDLVIPGEDPLRLEIDMDIKISLYSYERTVIPHYIGLDLKTQYSEIISGLKKIPIRNGFEDIHAGMIEALRTDTGAWRDDCWTRLVLLIGDEPGDTHNSGDVVKRMKLMTEAQYKGKPDLESLTEVGRQKKLTPIYAIYTEEAGVDAFRANVSPYASDVFSVKGMTDPVERQRLINFFFSSIREKQEKIRKELEFFTSQFTNRPQDLSSLPGVSQVAMETRARELGMSLEQFRQFARLVFFQGFANIHDESWKPGQENPILDPFRIRVMLSDDEVSILGEKTGKIGRAIADSLDDNNGLPIGVAGEDNKAARKLMLCKVFLQTLDSVVGSGKKYDGQKDLLDEMAAKLLAAIDQGKGTAKMTRLLKIPDSLPIRADGILAGSLADFVNSDPKRLRIEADHFKLKAKGLDRIKNSQVTPEDFLLVEDPVHAPGNRSKNWFFLQSLETTERYAYVPIGYIP